MRLVHRWPHYGHVTTDTSPSGACSSAMGSVSDNAPPPPPPAERQRVRDRLQGFRCSCNRIVAQRACTGLQGGILAIRNAGRDCKQSVAICLDSFQPPAEHSDEGGRVVQLLVQCFHTLAFLTVQRGGHNVRDARTCHRGRALTRRSGRRTRGCPPGGHPGGEVCGCNVIRTSNLLGRQPTIGDSPSDSAFVYARPESRLTDGQCRILPARGVRHARCPVSTRPNIRTRGIIAAADVECNNMHSGPWLSVR